MASVERGLSWGREGESADGASGVGVVTIPNIAERLVLPPRTRLSNVPPEKFDRYRLLHGDVLMIGSNGNADRVGQSVPVLEDLDLVYASFLMRIRPLKDVDARFLRYVVASPRFLRPLKTSTIGATSLKNLRVTEVRAALIPLPSLAEQQAIGRVLGAFDDLIENNQRRIEILEEMARLVYREWFVHFRFPGHEDAKLVDSRLGPIPAGWEVAAFADLADFVNGFAFKHREHWMDEGLPIVKIKELKSGITRDTPRYHGEDIPEKYFVHDGDVLFSWSADLDAYVWPGGPALLNQHLFVVRPHELSKIFLFHSLRGRMDEFRARSQGTTMKHIKRSALSEVCIVVPDRKTREAFEESVGSMLELQLNLSRQNRVLAEVRDLLLPRLVSGELDVSDLDLDLELVA